MNAEPADLKTLFYVFHRLHQGCMRDELEKRGLREIANPAVLFVLHQNKDAAMTQREIADKMGVSPPTIAVSVKRMERAGLAKKQADPRDLRKNCITLSEKGARLAQDCIAAEHALYDRIVEGFSSQELETLCGFYLRMMDNMRRSGCRGPCLQQPFPYKPDDKEGPPQC